MAHDSGPGGRMVDGRYRLGESLGRGGMGTVWLAYDELLRREVAVKEVRIPDDLDEMETQGRCERALREARAAARITHPNVVTIFDVAEDDGRPWIVMELVRAPSLTDVLDEGRMAPHEAAGVGLAVLAALRAARAADVLHRDVKPSNILMAPHGRIVLTDFGIATVAGSVTLTATGMLVGSPEYLAPERVLGRRPGPASDLWSLGVTLYQAVEGFSPFRRTGAMDTLSAVLTDEPPPPRQAGALWPAIEALLRKDPLQRADEDTAERLLTAALIPDAQSPVPPGTATVEGPNSPFGSTRSAWEQSPPTTPVPPAGAASAAGHGDGDTGGYPETGERAYSPADAVYGSPTADDRPNPILLGAAGARGSDADAHKRRRTIALGATVAAAVIALAVWLPIALGGPGDDNGGSGASTTTTDSRGGAGVANTVTHSRSVGTTAAGDGDDPGGETRETRDTGDDDEPTWTSEPPTRTHTPTATATWDETTEPPETHTPTTEPPPTRTVEPTEPGTTTGGGGDPGTGNSAAPAGDSVTGGSGGGPGG